MFSLLPPKCIMKAVHFSPRLRLSSKPPFSLSRTLRHSPVSLRLRSCPCYAFSIRSSGLLENIQSTRVSSVDSLSWLPVGLEGKSPPSLPWLTGPSRGLGLLVRLHLLEQGRREHDPCPPTPSTSLLPGQTFLP